MPTAGGSGMNAIEKPIDVATRETVAYLRAHLPCGATLLGIGCGAGQVARALFQADHGVLAIDSDAAAIDQARALGVDAQCAAWPDFRGGPFDAIAFTRSLHHIDPLEPSVRRARELLRQPGVLLVEDRPRDSLSTAEWTC